MTRQTRPPGSFSCGVPMSNRTPSPAFTRSSNASHNSTRTPFFVNPATFPMRTPRLFGNRPRTSIWWFTPSRKPGVSPRLNVCARSSSSRRGSANARAAELRVDRLAVGLRGRGDVRPALQPPFDLERDHARVDERVDQVERRQVLRTEQVRAVAEFALLAVHDHLVGQAARLGALPAVRAAAAERLAREALPAVRDTQSPVNEHLHRRVGVRGHLPNVARARVRARARRARRRASSRSRCRAVRSASSACWRGPRASARSA